MEFIRPSFEIIKNLSCDQIISHIERAGRVCYKSEDKITDTSGHRFIKTIISRGHESVIEHISVTCQIICDRGVSHEIVRHRIASYSQESTRYCNYNKNGLQFILPSWFSESTKTLLENISTFKCVPDINTKLSTSEIEWYMSCMQVNHSYLTMIESGYTPEQARSVLNNSIKTEIYCTMNLREWRHFFKLRTHKSAHPQMREIAIPMLTEFKEYIPIIFDDIS